MSADVFFVRDIGHALTATVHAGREAARSGASVEYQRGYIAAIQTMALFFGIAPDQVVRAELVCPVIDQTATN